MKRRYLKGLTKRARKELYRQRRVARIVDGVYVPSYSKEDIKDAILVILRQIAGRIWKEPSAQTLEATNEMMKDRKQFSILYKYMPEDVTPVTEPEMMRDLQLKSCTCGLNYYTPIINHKCF